MREAAFTRARTLAVVAVWLATGVIAGFGGPVAAQEVLAGVARQVKAPAEIDRAQGRGKMMIPGDRVYLGDSVRTGRTGQALIQLEDRTVITVGANAELKIDKFIYNPEQDLGELVASIPRGVFHFVSGLIAKNDDSAMRINTPVTSIGIRGTIAAGEASASEMSIVLLDPAGAGPGGAIVITTPSGQTARLVEPLDGITVRLGDPAPPVEVWNEGRVRALMARLGVTNFQMPRRDQEPEAVEPSDRAALGEVILTRSGCRRAVRYAAAQQGRDAGRNVGETASLSRDAFARVGIDLSPDTAGRVDIDRRGGRVWLGQQSLSGDQAVALATLCQGTFSGLR